ncbi:MAG: hypothetical protein CMQ21_15260 [Gammaproteobacteria bacterium]|nr:hypothetical protein [Gammaproteobacteria bacterium]MBP20229.1 hypothetical protein [Gammaproteobacteria bacterium]
MVDFAIVIPLVCIAYCPITAILGKQDPLGSSYAFQVFSPSLRFVFLGVLVLMFQCGIKRYTSTSS